MLPNPLHPAVVHFPIVFAVLLPIAAITALVFIHRGNKSRAPWGVVVAFAVALTGSSWASVQTGEEQEEIVEDVISHDPIHEHEEAAELFMLLSGITLVVVAGGLLGGKVGGFARAGGVAAAVVLLAAGAQVGHTGGELVYVHGAAEAYVDGGVDHEGVSRRGDRSDDDADDPDDDADDDPDDDADDT